MWDVFSKVSKSSCPEILLHPRHPGLLVKAGQLRFPCPPSTDPPPFKSIILDYILLGGKIASNFVQAYQKFPYIAQFFLVIVYFCDWINCQFTWVAPYMLLCTPMVKLHILPAQTIESLPVFPMYRFFRLPF